MRIKRYTEKDGLYHGELGFMCPGCGCRHFINDALTDLALLQPDRPVWTFNNDYDKPTIRASVLLKYPINKDSVEKMRVCHSFVTDGMIQFLPDCTHKLAGQTVELPEIEEVKK